MTKCYHQHPRSQGCSRISAIRVNVPFPLGRSQKPMPGHPSLQIHPEILLYSSNDPDVAGTSSVLQAAESMSPFCSHGSAGGTQTAAMTFKRLSLSFAKERVESLHDLGHHAHSSSQCLYRSLLQEEKRERRGKGGK